jgi:cation diffusion facilitator CzcD-associated flavoprotein CzcO
MAGAIVCGAGAAGLATAAVLERAGAKVTVLERSDGVGASWRTRYDGLRLNTLGWMSTMPGYRATRRRYGEFPSRDDWIRYLEDYCAHHRLDVRFGVQARKVTAKDGGWVVETDTDALEARFVVVATGYDHEPKLPDWPGRDRYAGELIHSSAYRNPDPYRGRDVVVVGPNTTGSEIANYLVKGGAARVRVACRTPPSLTKRKFLGASVNIPGTALNHVPLRVADEIAWLTQLAMFGRLDRYGLPRAPAGAATTLKLRHQATAYDDGFVAELKAGRIEIIAAVVGFDDDGVMLADGTRIQPDAVIAATGYHRGLGPLVGHLGVLGDDGIPVVSRGEQHPSAPGLFFNGYRADLSGQLRLMRLDARAIARAVRRHGRSSFP